MQLFKGKRFGRKFYIVAATVLLVFVGAGGYWLWRQQTQRQTAAQSTQQMQTSQARRGNLVISASATGTLVSRKQVNLSFSAAGTVAELNVQPGDTVKEGDLLARLEGMDQLEADVVAARLELASAQRALQELEDNALAALADARLALAEAKKAYEDAKDSLKSEGMARVDDDTLEAYYDIWDAIQKQYDALTASGGYNPQEYLELKARRDEAFATYEYYRKFTQYEIDASHAQLTIAAANVQKAEKTLALLESHDGIDPDELEQAQNKVANAQIKLEKAQQTLDGATLRAPFDGTIVSVVGEVGERAGTSTFITLADLTHPYVQFYVDETDMDKAVLGNQAEVVFDALPNNTYRGVIIQVEPELVTVNNYQTLRGLIRIDEGPDLENFAYPQGLNASVEIISARAEDALLIPVDALRDLGDGEYAVFVVGKDGKLKLRQVQVGLIGDIQAEIVSGLEMGETVSTGIVETE